MRCELDQAAVLPAVGLRSLAPQNAARSCRDVLVRAPQDNGGQHSQRRTTLARNLMAFATPSETRPTGTVRVGMNADPRADGREHFGQPVCPF